MSKPKAERAGAKVAFGVILLLAVLAGAGYLGAYAGASDKTPRGTEVAGVSVGGRTQAEAARTLERGLADAVARPIKLEIDGKTQTLDPAAAGLAVDYAASVRDAGAQRSWNPKWLWNYYTGGAKLTPVVTVDQPVMDAYLATLAQESGVEPVDGAIRFVDQRVRVSKAKTGLAIDPVAAQQAITDAFLDPQPVARLTRQTVQPDIEQADVEAALTAFANPAVTGPVILRFGDNQLRLQPSDFATALKMVPENGALVGHVNRKRLLALVEGQTAGAGAPVDAAVRLVDGKPKVIAAKPGLEYNPDDVVNAFVGAVVLPEGQREVEVPAVVKDAAFTTQDAEALKINEKVSEFTTYFPYAEYRNINIGRAMELINGAVLKPGDVFSLNETVGERTPENGFVKGFIIADGIFKEDYGGGVSQSATTTFNAAFFAGLKDIEHKPHSFFIDRYPAGREATVAWPTVDLKFQNDTPYGVLIQAELIPSTPSSQGVAKVTMWSTKYWEITATDSGRYNITSPATRILHTPDCYPNTGYGGFDLDVTRHFHNLVDPSLDHTEVMHTHYTPADTVICQPPLPPEPPKP